MRSQRSRNNVITRCLLIGCLSAEGCKNVHCNRSRMESPTTVSSKQQSAKPLNGSRLNLRLSQTSGQMTMHRCLCCIVFTSRCRIDVSVAAIKRRDVAPTLDILYIFALMRRCINAKCPLGRVAVIVELLH